MKISRRNFNSVLLSGLAVPGFLQQGEDIRSGLALVKNPDRKAALEQAFGTFVRGSGGKKPDFGGRNVYIKGNFNSADPFPATTHPETLKTVVALLRRCNSGRICLLERSGMGYSREIWAKLGIDKLAGELDIQLISLEDLASSEWITETLPGSHWRFGVEAPKLLREPIVQICNVKTHRFGAGFSASLKNSIGLVAKRSYFRPGYNYMEELHQSEFQRSMIAEVNQLYAPALVFMDAAQVFIEEGPEQGEIATVQAVAVSSDRIAIDVVALALLRYCEAPGEMGRMMVFEEEQIKRAAELKIGVRTPGQIRFWTTDPESSRLLARLGAILSESLESAPR